MKTFVQKRNFTKISNNNYSLKYTENSILIMGVIMVFHCLFKALILYAIYKIASFAWVLITKVEPSSLGDLGRSFQVGSIRKIEESSEDSNCCIKSVDIDEHSQKKLNAYKNFVEFKKENSVCEVQESIQSNMDMDSIVQLIKNSHTGLIQERRMLYFKVKDTNCAALDISKVIVSEETLRGLEVRLKLLQIIPSDEEKCELIENSTYEDYAKIASSEEINYEGQNGVLISTNCKVNGECSSISISRNGKSLSCKLNDNNKPVCECV